MAILQSYDLNGKKLSFANWVSNLSPTDTPFLSMTSKDKIDQTIFQWQTDSLQRVENNAQVEGWESETASTSFRPTQVLSNYTQILRKVISVSDTAEAVEAYGRESEMSYQMEKASQELKRDLEYSFLNNLLGSAGDETHPRITAGFPGLCSGVGVPDSDTGAILNFDRPYLELDSITEMCGHLYQNGSNANIIMFHPRHARIFSKLQEYSDTRVRLFNNVGELDLLINVFVDQFGNKYKLVPNRWMPGNRVYFFNPDNWEQKVLRAPKRVKLGKLGSYTQWMIEMEVGLAHVNPEASGILNIRTAPRAAEMAEKFIEVSGKKYQFGVDRVINVAKANQIDFKFKSADVNTYDILLYQDGELMQEIKGVTNTATVDFQIVSPTHEDDTGVYKFFVKDPTTGKIFDESDSVYIEVT